ncbi:hypothetical protein Tco_1576503 [Tanacetum coccineum]
MNHPPTPIKHQTGSPASRPMLHQSLNQQSGEQHQIPRDPTPCLLRVRRPNTVVLQDLKANDYRKQTYHTHVKLNPTPDSGLKPMNNNFFWVDEKVFPTVVAWRMASTNLRKAQGQYLLRVWMWSPLDFSNEDAPPPVTQGAKAGVHGPTAAEQEIPVTYDAEATEAVVEPDLEKEVISMGPTIKKRRRQRDAGTSAPAWWKSLADMSVDTEPVIHVHETQEPLVATQRVSNLDPLSYAKSQPNPKQDVVYTVMLTTYFHCSVDADLPFKEEGVAGNQDSEKSTPSPSITGSPGSIYQPGWGVPTPEVCQEVVDHIAPPGYFSELRHMPNDEFWSQYNINLAKEVAMGSQLRFRFEQEAKLLKKSVAR